MSKFYLVVDCPHCDAEIKYLCEDMSHDVPHVSYNFASQEVFNCDECGKCSYTTEIDLLTDD